MSTTDKSVQTAGEASAAARYCIEPGCGKRLAVHNPGKKCFCHPSKSRRAVIGMSLAHNPIPLWTPPLLFPAPQPRARKVVQQQTTPEVSVVTTPPVQAGYTPPGKRMLELVCKFFKQSEKEMVGPKRGRTLSHARQVLMYLLTKDLKQSSVAVGRIVAREHATVLHGVDRIDYMLKIDTKLQSDIAAIRFEYQKPLT